MSTASKLPVTMDGNGSSLLIGSSTLQESGRYGCGALGPNSTEDRLGGGLGSHLRLERQVRYLNRTPELRRYGPEDDLEP